MSLHSPIYKLNSLLFSQPLTTMSSQEQNEQTQEPQKLIENFKYSKRVVLKSILNREDKGLGLVGQRVVVGGWVKSKKEKKDKSSNVASSKEDGEEGGHCVTCCEGLLSRIPLLRNICKIVVRRDGGVVGKEESHVPTSTYLRINDGSCVHNLQVVADSSMSLLTQVMSNGTSILVEGLLERTPIQGKHALQLKVEKILHVGVVDLKKYPLAKKRLSLEFIRSYPHLRPRTTTVATITQIRSTLSFATHTFFHDNGFIYVHMPVITTSELNGVSRNTSKIATENDSENVSLEVIKASIEEKSKRVEELKRSDSNREALLAAVKDLQKTNQLVKQVEEKQKESSIKVGDLNFSNNNMFSLKALYLESYACALSSVYTFGPILKSESEGSSSAANHLVEMWMVEVELAFAELEDAMNCSEDYLKFIFQSILKDCTDDLKFLSKQIDKNSIDRLQSIVSNPFARITYTEALELLKKVTNKTFEMKLEWGVNLTEEQESYLANEVFKQPVIIYDYPKEIKPFYVHVKEDGKTASAFDIIAPKVGVLVRGSQKEEQIDKISKRMEELGLPREQYEWHLDIRRHGTVKHSGFSVEFENVVKFSTGLDDIKDVIPFPRSFDFANA